LELTAVTEEITVCGVADRLPSNIQNLFDAQPSSNGQTLESVEKSKFHFGFFNERDVADCACSFSSNSQILVHKWHQRRVVTYRTYTFSKTFYITLKTSFTTEKVNFTHLLSSYLDSF
jgi:hypothetical protein